MPGVRLTTFVLFSVGTRYGQCWIRESFSFGFCVLSQHETLSPELSGIRRRLRRTQDDRAAVWVRQVSLSLRGYGARMLYADSATF